MNEQITCAFSYIPVGPFIYNRFVKAKLVIRVM